MNDLIGFDEPLAERVSGNTKRYMQLISQAADNIIRATKPTGTLSSPLRRPTHASAASGREDLGPPPNADEIALRALEEDPIDNMLKTLRQSMQAQGALGEDVRATRAAPVYDRTNLNPKMRVLRPYPGGMQEELDIPPELRRKYQLLIKPSHDNDGKSRPIREVRADKIGHLVVIKVLVTRVTDVKPLVSVATYLSGERPSVPTATSSSPLQDGACVRSAVCLAVPPWLACRDV